MVGLWQVWRSTRGEADTAFASLEVMSNAHFVRQQSLLAGT